VSIIAELHAKHGEIFKEIVGTEDAHELELASDNIRARYVPSKIRDFITYELNRKVRKEGKDLSADEICDILDDAMNRIGVDPVYTCLEVLKKQFANQIGSTVDNKRIITSLAANELKLTNPGFGFWLKT